MKNQIILFVIVTLLLSCSSRKMIGEYKVNKTIDEYGKILEGENTLIQVTIKEKGFNLHPTIEFYIVEILSMDSLKIKNKIGLSNNFQVYYEYSNISFWLSKIKEIKKGYFTIKEKGKDYFLIRFNIPKQENIPAFRKRIKVLKN